LEYQVVFLHKGGPSPIWNFRPQESTLSKSFLVQPKSRTRLSAQLVWPGRWVVSTFTAVPGMCQARKHRGSALSTALRFAAMGTKSALGVEHPWNAATSRAGEGGVCVVGNAPAAVGTSPRPALLDTSRWTFKTLGHLPSFIFHATRDEWVTGKKPKSRLNATSAERHTQASG
jgi:hypothetical protein